MWVLSIQELLLSQADHLTLSELLVPLSNKRRESLDHSPTYSHCPKTKHWKHLLMETITHDPNEGTWEVTGCPLDSHSKTTWGKHCGYCRSSLQQGDGHTSSTLSLVAHALEPFAISLWTTCPNTVIKSYSPTSTSQQHPLGAGTPDFPSRPRGRLRSSALVDINWYLNSSPYFKVFWWKQLKGVWKALVPTFSSCYHH